MKRVTGIGGIFFKSENPAQTKLWYETHLGIPVGDYGHVFQWKDDAGGEGITTWNVIKQSSTYFGDPEQAFMVNYRVHDLKALLEALRSEGVEVVGELQEYDYGKFASIKDCDGRRIELWEPIDAPLVEDAATQD